MVLVNAPVSLELLIVLELLLSHLIPFNVI